MNLRGGTSWVTIFITSFISVKFYVYIPLYYSRRLNFESAGLSSEDLAFVEECSLWITAATRMFPRRTFLRMITTLSFTIGLFCLTAFSGSFLSTLIPMPEGMRSISDLISGKFVVTAHERSTMFQNLVENLVNDGGLSQNEVVTVSTEAEVSQLFKADSDNIIASAKRSLVSFDDLFYLSSVQIPPNEYANFNSRFAEKGSTFREVFNCG